MSSEACRLAAAEGRRERRRLAREAVGELPGLDTDRTSVVSLPINNAPTSVDADRSVVAGVLEEISTLESPRPALVAVAIALAAVLDNPKATTSKPAAAGALVNILNQLRKSAGDSKPKLAAVREMTKAKNGQA
jgi:hypothetical protein